MLKIQIIETVVVIGAYFLISYVIMAFVNNALKKAEMHRSRRKTIMRVSNLLITGLVFIFLSAIWGLKQNEIAVFVSTLITALGIAFFAQWSLLSNITSSILIFFNHPMRIGDTIKVLDKDYPFEGEIVDLTYFFMHVRTPGGETITIPNSQVLQKSICVISKRE